VKDDVRLDAATLEVLRNALAVLGVSAPDAMKREELEA
jgi:arginyl-tRNA synthetase